MTAPTQRLSDMSTLKAFQQDINSAPSDEVRMRALKNFHEAFVARSTAIRESIETHEKKQTQLLDSAQREAKAAEDEVAALEAELRALESSSAAERTSLAACPGKAYRQFLMKRADLHSQLKVVRDVLNGVVAGSAMKMQDSSDVDFASSDTFRAKERALRSNIDALRQDATTLSRQFAFASEVDLSSVEQELEEVRALGVAAAESLNVHNQKTTALKEGIQEFDKERKRLLLWCRQQKTNLDAMTEPEHVQEFCASLLNNFPTMEENFNVLLEVAEPLLPNIDVQNALIETNEVWFHLQVSAYERLRHTILEIHPKSKLEDEVREFNTYSKRVGEFLETFLQLLSSPTDPESQTYVRPLLEQCESLQALYPAHQGLGGQLREFAQRMEATRESYASLRRAVLSRLTFLASSAPALSTSMHRKEEYVARMKDLKKWVEVKSQGESWKDIHQRVLAIRELIEKEQAALLQEKK